MYNREPETMLDHEQCCTWLSRQVDNLNMEIARLTAMNVELMKTLEWCEGCIDEATDRAYQPGLTKARRKIEDVLTKAKAMLKEGGTHMVEKV